MMLLRKLYSSLLCYACLFLTLMIVLIPQARAADYFWVGGTGNWSDFANHWATSSGGNNFHSIPPTQNDDVYFDQNSFTATGQVVTMNMPFIYTKSIDWTGVQHNPTWAGESEVNIYGSMILAPVMQMDLSDINLVQFKFLGTTPGLVINTYGHTLAHPYGFIMVHFDGAGGTYSLESDLNLGDPFTGSDVLLIEQGTFQSNGYSIRSAEVVFYVNSADFIAMDTSRVYSGNVIVHGDNEPVMDADSMVVFTHRMEIDGTESIHLAHVYGPVMGPVAGGIAIFDTLHLHQGLNSTGIDVIWGDFQYNHWFHISDSGRTLNVYGDHHIADRFTIDSKPGFPVRIQGDSEFSKSNGSICFEWLYLENSIATGGANWYAGWQSQDLGSNAGWLFTSNDSCSQLVSVVEAELQELQWSPNPVSQGQDLKVQFVPTHVGEIKVELYSLQGIIVKSWGGEAHAGFFEKQIGTEGLAGGTYYGVVTLGNTRQGQLVVIE